VRARPRGAVSPWSAATVGLLALLATPVVVVLSSLAVPAADVWAHVARTQLAELLANTVALVGGVGVGTLVLGAGLAWLVAGHTFPGRGVFEWALVLPLAIPAYVIGFAFLGLLDYAGPVQSWMRAHVGPGFTLEVRSYAGVVAVMTLVFYPYVYLVARGAFRDQGAATIETARSLGCSRWGAFVRVTLPMARPSLVAGASLAMMEALADFGTVATFGYRTLTEAIYRVWYGMFDRAAATQLAVLLLVFALGLVLLERSLRGHARFVQGQRRGPAGMPVALRGPRALAATAACAAVLTLAFVVPVGQLLFWAADAARAWPALLHFWPVLRATLTLAGTAAVLTCAAAAFLAYAARLHRTAAVRLASQVASLSYALPGAVVAVGVLVPLAWIDHALIRASERLGGPSLGLLLTGSMAGLLFAYVVRFLAVGFQTLDASLARIPPGLDDAARSLGERTSGILRRVHAPLLRSSLVTAAILVFVETMKELPATILLRPFGMSTLALEVWERTSESLWSEAATPALAIVAAGLAPVAIAIRLSRRTSR
jgi:iron(III) transport system permease protein